VRAEERFTNLRLSAACVQLNREQISELVAITATLFEERRHIARLLSQLPDSFAEVRKLLNELARTIN
jgi:Tfp pilus assembly protein PilO